MLDVYTTTPHTHPLDGFEVEDLGFEVSGLEFEV